MRLTKSFTRGPVVGLLAGSLWIAGSGLTALGASVFTVDSSQSRVSISGSVLGTPLYAQGSGSLTTQYGGTLLADVGANAIQFTGQSQVVAFDSGSWHVAAARDLQVDVTSGALALVNGQFDTQGISVFIPAGAPSSLAYRVQGGINESGAVSLAGESASGQVAQGSLVTMGSLQVLTIPIHYSFYFSLASPNDTTVTLTGQVVATRSL